MPKSHTIEGRVEEIIRWEMGLPLDTRIAGDTRLVEDLRCDSLDLVELVMGIEEEFGVEITDEAAERFTTVGSVCSHLKELQVR